jgi:hypothetical protein
LIGSEAKKDEDIERREMRNKSGKDIRDRFGNGAGGVAVGVPAVGEAIRHA